MKDSYVQKIIVKDSSVNGFDLLSQAFVYYVSNIGNQNHWKKADLKRSKYVESLAKEKSLPWINDISIEIKCKKERFFNLMAPNVKRHHYLHNVKALIILINYIHHFSYPYHLS